MLYTKKTSIIQVKSTETIGKSLLNNELPSVTLETSLQKGTIFTNLQRLPVQSTYNLQTKNTQKENDSGKKNGCYNFAKGK